MNPMQDKLENCEQQYKIVDEQLNQQVQQLIQLLQTSDIMNIDLDTIISTINDLKFHKKSLHNRIIAYRY